MQYLFKNIYIGYYYEVHMFNWDHLWLHNCTCIVATNDLNSSTLSYSYNNYHYLDISYKLIHNVELKKNYGEFVIFIYMILQNIYLSLNFEIKSYYSIIDQTINVLIN
jgi:hypothetical protein